MVRVEQGQLEVWPSAVGPEQTLLDAHQAVGVGRLGAVAGGRLDVAEQHEVVGHGDGVRGLLQVARGTFQWRRAAATCPRP